MSGLDASRPAREAYEEALRIVEAADVAGLPVRIAGSAAVFSHAPSAERVFAQAEREAGDIDIVTRSKVRSDAMDDLLGGLGYEPHGQHNVWQAETRQIFERAGGGLHVDVFRDAMEFCHPVEIRDRLEADHPTIPLPELVLTKLQIVEINAKDLLDMAVLLLDHELGEAPDTIDASVIASTLANDWGFWHTATTNLAKLREHLAATPLDANERDVVLGRLTALEERIEAEPKSRRFKMRARIGTRVRWYQDVEEVQR